jgi:protein-S-isoprenylcysteine O-methyltransferase Ste14
MTMTAKLSPPMMMDPRWKKPNGLRVKVVLVLLLVLLVLLLVLLVLLLVWVTSLSLRTSTHCPSTTCGGYSESMAMVVHQRGLWGSTPTSTR